MAVATPKPSPAAALAKTVAKFAAGWAFLFWFGGKDSRLDRIDHFTRDAIARIFAGLPSAARNAEILYQKLGQILGGAFVIVLFFGTGFAVLGALTRMLARARVRAGQSDFLDRLRDWTAARAKTTRFLFALPSLVMATLYALPGPWELEHLGAWLSDLSLAAGPLLVAGWGIYAMMRKGLRELLAPTLGGPDAKTTFEINADEIAFDAVAVTPRTLGIVATFTALMIAIPLAIARLPILELFRHGSSVFYLFGAYAAFAASGAYIFRKASRIAVGVDGVHVHGTSRARFFAYRDIESARTEGSDLILLRGEKIVLRLQLHGEDAARRDAVLARIAENLARVREGRGAPAAQLVASSSKAALARIAEGAGDYRMATLSREQLWALVEGPEIDASARKAAAEALARSNDGSERARLRVAAEHCAEPQVRVALEEIARDVGDAPISRAPGAASRIDR
jgi:hypothetical protein